MKKKRADKKYILFFLCAILITMQAGYAVLQTRLKVKGMSRITSLWDVRITNVTVGTAT